MKFELKTKKDTKAITDFLKEKVEKIGQARLAHVANRMIEDWEILTDGKVKPVINDELESTGKITISVSQPGLNEIEKKTQAFKIVRSRVNQYLKENIKLKAR
jgi:hypothetical protein